MASATSPKSQLGKTQRLPAPTLFVGPPSRNASSTSIANVGTGDTKPAPRAPLTRQPSRLRNEQPNSQTPAAVDAPSVLSPSDNVKPSPFGRRQPAITIQTPTQGDGSTGGIGIGGGADAKTSSNMDAIWTEMQNTLNEVELSAHSGSHVFSSRHAKALEELRAAQISLAQAWARSEADEEATRSDEVNAIKKGKEEAKRTEMSYEEVLAGERLQKLGLTMPGEKVVSAGGRPKSDSNASAKSTVSNHGNPDGHLAQETENDILLARRRREANDKYFQRAKAGVKDVVAKLEEVKEAMKGVEVESREIWGTGRRGSGTDSITTGSAT